MRFPLALGVMLPILLAAAGVAACGSSAGSSGSSAGSPAPATATSQQLTLYTSVTQNTVTAVVDGFSKANPGVKVSVFRATTGQLNARITADQHSGGLRADVIWGTDPLSMESFAQENLFRPWPLPGLAGRARRGQGHLLLGHPRALPGHRGPQGPEPDAADLVRAYQFGI